MDQKTIKEWIEKHQNRLQPLEKSLDLAHWALATTGKKETEIEVASLRTQYRKIYANSQDFQFLSAARNYLSTSSKHQLRRQVELLWRGFAGNQFDAHLIEQISQLESELEGIYSNFRGQVDGKDIDNNGIRKILRNEDNSEQRKKAWMAAKQIGPKVKDKVLQLVKLRNQGAQKCGYKNFYQMSMDLDELNEDRLFSLLKDLEEKTTPFFLREKKKLDQELAKRFGVTIDQLRPWHYADPFFQDVPPRKTFQLDPYFKDQDLIALTQKTYEKIGMEIDEILEGSDLFGREGKDQHAFCTQIGRSKDVRVLCNLQESEYWMATMLHEFGHAVYDWYIDETLPYFLRMPAHILSTEAIAMLFGRLTRDPAWLEEILGLPKEEITPIEQASREQESLGMMIFVHWVMVMCHFERALYQNPEQDLNSLWWQLVKRFQDIRLGEARNEPDWATKIHIALAPVYYQNYLLGELIASQLENHLQEKIVENKLPYFLSNKSGDFLREEYFKPGGTLRWDHHVQQTLGEPLNPHYFINQYTEQLE